MRSGVDRDGLTPLPWAEIARWALLGTLLLLAFTMFEVARHGGSNPVSLIQPGKNGPSIAVIERDFPQLEAPAGIGLDGQQFYAIARNPLHLDEAAKGLDRPRYRLQRPLLPWAAWLLHPSGGGTGLIVALFTVGAVMVFVGAIGTGVLAVGLGGKPWMATLLPILPGTYFSLRVTVSDAPALALAMVALALSIRRRPILAVLVGVLAVLAKEPMILIFVGWALWRRDRQSFAMVAIPGAVAAAWMWWLTVALPGNEANAEIGLPPFRGLLESFTDHWSHGNELVGMAVCVSALTIGIAVIIRRRGHPLWWPVVVLVGFASLLNSVVLGMNFGGTRSNQPLLLLGLLALLTGSPALTDDESSAVPRDKAQLAASAPAQPSEPQ